MATNNSVNNDLSSGTGLPVTGLANGTDGELITWDASGVAATVSVGTATHVLTSNGVGLAPTFQAAAGGGSGSIDVNQVAHGLAVNDVIRLSGVSTYTKAQADSGANAEVVGIVTAVAGVDDFTVQQSGHVTGLTALTANTVYFLSPGTAGLLTATAPTTLGQISRPVLITDTTTSAWIFPYRGNDVEIASQNSQYDIAMSAGYSTAGVKEDIVVQDYAHIVMARTGEFTGESGYIETAPTGADAIVDVEKNGTTIYSTKPEFAAASNTLTAGVLKTDGTEDFVPGDRITIKVTQIGSTEPGEGLRFTVTGEI